MNSLKATKRTSASTGQVNKLRSEGFIPGVLYGGKKNNLNISLKKLHLQNIINTETFMSKVYDLDIDGNSEKAFEIVRDTIRKIKNREITKEDVVVYTQLTRPLDKYKVTAPHIKVAKDMKNRGEEVVTGTSVGYIITEGGGSISERANQVDEVDVKKIDRKYYVENQIIPAVSRVMEALGYGKEDLLGKKQSTLEGF